MNTYLILKALHLIFMVCWFAVLFYLPRLFVYHAAAEDQVGRDRFKVMERKLYYGIGAPSVILTIICGAFLLYLNPAWLGMGWMHVKLTLLVALVAYHLSCGHYLKKFARDENINSHVFYRFFNEIPVIGLLGIIFLAVLKPF